VGGDVRLKRGTTFGGGVFSRGLTGAAGAFQGSEGLFPGGPTIISGPTHTGGGVRGLGAQAGGGGGPGANFRIGNPIHLGFFFFRGGRASHMGGGGVDFGGGRRFGLGCLFLFSVLHFVLRFSDLYLTGGCSRALFVYGRFSGRGGKGSPKGKTPRGGGGGGAGRGDWLRGGGHFVATRYRGRAKIGSGGGGGGGGGGRAGLLACWV